MLKKGRSCLYALTFALCIIGCGDLEPPPVIWNIGKHVIFDDTWVALFSEIFDTAQIDRETASDNFSMFVRRTDDVYEALKDFTNTEPSTQNKLRFTIQPDSHFDKYEQVNVAAAHAHLDTALICFKKETATRTLNLCVLNNGWDHTIVHEMGHTFDKIWYDLESTANLMSAYIQEKFGVTYSGAEYKGNNYRGMVWDECKARYSSGQITGFTHGLSSEYTGYTLYSFGIAENTPWQSFKSANINFISNQSNLNKNDNVKTVIYYSMVANYDGRGKSILFRLLPDQGQMFETLEGTASLSKESAQKPIDVTICN